MARESLLCAFVLTALCATPIAARGQAAPPPPESQDASAAEAEPGASDDGPLLLASVGPSYLAGLQSLDSGQDASVEGLAVGFGFLLAAPLSDAVALGADLALIRAGSAEHGVLSSTVFTALHLGAGVTWFVSPSGTYLSGSLGLARSSVEAERLRLGIELPDNDASDLGLGVRMSFGHQLRVGERFGLGGALSLLASFANNPVGGEDGLRTVLAATLAVTVGVR